MPKQERGSPSGIPVMLRIGGEVKHLTRNRRSSCECMEDYGRISLSGTPITFASS